jgi:hypothetical protein
LTTQQGPIVISWQSSLYRYLLKIRDAPDTVFAGYPANPKSGYRISGASLLKIANNIKIRSVIKVYRSGSWALKLTDH